MAVARAESIVNADLGAVEVNLEGVGLESLEPVLPLLSRLPRLKALRLARNKLTGLPNDLTGICQLEYLDLSANPITGASTIMQGLSGLAILRHLYVDLPCESEEDEVIVAVQSLESFNGTSLTEVFEEVRGAMEGDKSDDGDTSPAPRIFDATDTSVLDEAPIYGQEQQRQQQQQQQYSSTQFQQWKAEDTKNIQGLYTLVTNFTGNVFTQKEFNMYVANVVRHLCALTAAEPDPSSREGEKLKAKKVLYEYCLEELCRVVSGRDAVLGRALTEIAKAQAGLLESYDRLWRRITEEMNGRIAVMKKDMQDAIQEIESLMGQLGQKENDSNGGSGTNAVNGMELQRLQEEVGKLRTENERLQTKLRLVEASACSPDAVAPGALRNSSASADHSRISPSGSRAPQSGSKVLTLKQLKQAIEDIYASKSKYDIKCSESHLPRETMEQHMYTYLNQRYGLKHIILDWATAIIQGIKKYNLEDNDVAVFGKILRNEIDEEFRFVQRQVRETVHELLRVYIKGKRPSKSDTDINKIVQKKTNGTLLEDEWVDIVKYMYNTEDAVSIIMRVRDYLRQVSQPRRRSSIQRGHEIASIHDVQLPYAELIRILLDFQLEGHERFLARFHSIFCRHDADRNGIVNAQEFNAILKTVDASKTDEEIEALLELIDPFGNQLITYSECVTFLSAEIVRMMKAVE
ncbi:hypothetical protein, conserved [Trypanosoma cruzi]|uniref:EF-hand domain-containing protein n=1 Tax=Trypanosoma cruzi (strain CL Brener) TaxID=353153 RepID=Q4E2K6_TRYCC|nr:hypothetical protein, conserved [Trypanosoma cruzi]EAN99004.1 hypothetical protein, conserved [Trypanosoma cruzi]|eukprot:XP_820855.1 hypothetical protein [Trypanosoma cruzi strain CL Brener]